MSDQEKPIWEGVYGICAAEVRESGGIMKPFLAGERTRNEWDERGIMAVAIKKVASERDRLRAENEALRHSEAAWRMDSGIANARLVELEATAKERDALRARLAKLEGTLNSLQDIAESDAINEQFCEGVAYSIDEVRKAMKGSGDGQTEAK